MKRILNLISGLFVFSALCTVAQAADVSELRSTQSGRGDLGYRSRSGSTEVRSVEVYLARNGRMFVRVADGSTPRIDGTWRNDGGRSCRIEVDHFGPDRARGNGTVEHDGRGHFSRIRLTGDVGRNRFSLNFDAEGSQSGQSNQGNQASSEFRATKDGNGSMYFTSRPGQIKVTRLTVVLHRNGEFDVSGAIRGMDSYHGQWKPDGDRQISLSIQRLNSNFASGTGTVVLNGREGFDRVTMNGRTPGQTFGLQFEVGAIREEEDLRTFSRNSQDEVRRKFRDCRRFRFSHEVIGNVTFGNRSVTGDVTVLEGPHRGDYRYRVTLGASSAQVQSISTTRR